MSVHNYKKLSVTYRYILKTKPTVFSNTKHILSVSHTTSTKKQSRGKIHVWHLEFLSWTKSKYEFNQKTNVAFIDFKKVFDRVDKNVL